MQSLITSPQNIDSFKDQPNWRKKWRSLQTARLLIRIPLICHSSGERNLPNCVLISRSDKLIDNTPTTMKTWSILLLSKLAYISHNLEIKIINSIFQTHPIKFTTLFVHCFSGSEFGFCLNLHFIFSYEALTRRINRLIKTQEDK